MATLLHATDLHFGDPPAHVGAGKALTALWGGHPLPPKKSWLRAIMATHDPAVTEGLIELIDEVCAELDGIIFSGDVATTSATAALGAACAWLRRAASAAPRAPIFVLAGNHDRFGAPPLYAPGARVFDRAVGTLGGRITTAAPAHGVRAHAIDRSCLLVCADLSLTSAGEATHLGGHLSQGIVRSAEEVLDAIENDRTSATTHVIVATHFPLNAPDPTIAAHTCLDGDILLNGLAALANELPVLVVSGHWHREAKQRSGNLFLFVGATSSMTLHPHKIALDSTLKPPDLTLPGAHSANVIRTIDGGFSITRWRYGRDPAVPGTRRFCSPTAVIFR